MMEVEVLIYRWNTPRAGIQRLSLRAVISELSVHGHLNCIALVHGKQIIRGRTCQNSSPDMWEAKRQEKAWERIEALKT